MSSVRVRSPAFRLGAHARERLGRLLRPRIDGVLDVVEPVEVLEIELAALFGLDDGAELPAGDGVEDLALHGGAAGAGRRSGYAACGGCRGGAPEGIRGYCGWP